MPKAYRICLYNPLNWPSYNAENLGFLNNNSHAAITIATDIINIGWPIGWDSPNTEDAIILGELELEELVQKIGRVGQYAQQNRSPMDTRESLTVACTVLNRQNENTQLGGPDLSNPTIHWHTHRTTTF